jgi:AraC-like DNA-binding protein
MSHILTTDCVEPEQRLEYWIDMICKTYVQLECEPLRRGAFNGSIQSNGLPGLDLSVVSSGAQNVLRTPSEIARTVDDYFIVSIQTQGNAIISQDGRDAVLSPGDFALYDSTRPYRLHFDTDFQEIVLKLRRDELRNLVRDPEKLTAMTVCGRAGAGHLLINMIKTLWEDFDALQPASAAAVANGVLDILTAGLHTLPVCNKPQLSSLAAYHLARIKQRIDERLRDPLLSMGAIAAELGLSVGHIHRLFKNEALTPAQYMWNRRLEACGRDLIDRRYAHQSVAEIAFRWGFNDAAHFSRAFRDRFGMSPRDWRNRSDDGGATP